MASTKVSPASDSSGSSSYSETAHYDAHSHSEMMIAARAPEKAPWQRFRVARPSPGTLVEVERARLGVFLTQYPPSKVKTSDKVICIYSNEDRDYDERAEWDQWDQKESRS